MNFFQLLKIKGMHQAMLVSMLTLAVREAMTTYFPLYGIEKGFSLTQIGLIIGIQGFAAMIIRLLQGKLLQAFSVKNILFICLFSSGCCLLSLYFFSDILIFSIAALLLGLGLGLTQPLSTVSVVNIAPVAFSAQALGIRLGGNRLSQLVSPLSFGMVAQWATVGFVFGIAAILLMGGSVYYKYSSSDSRSNHNKP
ncbi:MFS transporter [Evansella sp. AB-rgal1]|uniref:MFS transporter n=1 Tax=Evansella sp. AB-rgal1 TaxID=3242696 RepID=UPI00359F07DD